MLFSSRLSSYFRFISKNCKVFQDKSEWSDLLFLDIEMSGVLPEGRFLRVHKSFIVPVHRIASRTSREIVLTPEARIPVGRSYADGVPGRND